MRKILLSLVFLTRLFIPDAPADPMDSFKGICLNAREAILNEDADILRECKNSLSELKESVGIVDFLPMEFITVKPEQEESLAGHTLFKDDYFLELLRTDFGRKGRARSDIHTTVRDTNDIIVTHHVVPANGDGEYISQGCDQMRFVIITERPCHISVSIRCPNSDISYDFDDNEGIVDCSWSLGSTPEDVMLTIHNHSGASVCFMLASQG